MAKRLIFGLDLGLNNVGHCAVRVGDDEVDILHLGTYVFASPLVDDNKPGDGYSEAQRGLQRRGMRTIRRRAWRKKGLYSLLAKYGFLPQDRIERTELLCHNYLNGQPCNPYILREKALLKPLSTFELARVLTHLANHRGFLSPRAQRLVGIADDLLTSGDDNDEETGKMLVQIKATKDLLKASKMPTIGAFYAERLRHNQPIRSKTKPNRKIGGEKNENRDGYKPADLKERLVRPDRQLIRRIQTNH